MQANSTAFLGTLPTASSHDILILEQQLNKSERRIGLLDKKNADLLNQIKQYQTELESVRKFPTAKIL